MKKDKKTSIARVTISILSLIIVLGTCLMWAGFENITMESLVLLASIQGVMITAFTYHKHSKRKFEAPILKQVNPLAAKSIELATNKNCNKNEDLIQKIENNEELKNIIESLKKTPLISRLFKGL